MKRIEEFHREDKRRTAFSLHQSGIIEQRKGNYKEAEKLYSKAWNFSKN